MKLRRALALAAASLWLLAPVEPVLAQGAGPGPVPYWLDADPSVGLPQDRGASGMFQALNRLATTASLLHTTAHPDDEHSAVLTYLARGMGARTTLLTLNRGEGGANAIGPELFDGLGVIRTEELLLSGRYYGLAQQYFTNAVDYGFSKTLAEAFRSWDRDALLEDMVRVIRQERPLVVVSRFHGSTRDGHGHHQAAGALTPEAVEAAADPRAYPDQIESEGLRPWRVKRLFRGGVRDGEAAHVVVDAGAFAPWLGTTFDRMGALGVSLQRSQTAGRIWGTRGNAVYRYELLSGPEVGDSGTHFFEGLDTGLAGVFDLVGETAESTALDALVSAESEVTGALSALRVDDVAAVTPYLERALAHLRHAYDLSPGRFDARVLIARKIQQAEAALRLATGTTLVATATREPGAGEPVYRVAPGDVFYVGVELETASRDVEDSARIDLAAPVGWSVTEEAGGASAPPGATKAKMFRVEVSRDAEPGGRYFSRESLRENHYSVDDSSALHRPWGGAPLVASAFVPMQGGDAEAGYAVRTLVRGEHVDLPRGVFRRELRVVPSVSLAVDPDIRVVSTEDAGGAMSFSVEVRQESLSPASGTVQLDVPAGWDVLPAELPFSLARPGEVFSGVFQVIGEGAWDGRREVGAVARVGGREYRESDQRIEHPDLESRSLRAPARTLLVALDVEVEADLVVGYVMGVGDEIPQAITELGARVDLLDQAALSAADFGSYDAIFLGTRAYAVRPELVPLNPRLLEYVSGGGHLIVLYQTQEFDPSSLAPYPAVLPGRAEEISEEDAEVRLLAPDHPLLSEPNPISAEDFEGWIEQRGSKFFSEWSEPFTALVESRDEGQDPQRGIWVTAPLGAGHYTYVALALHRQTPYGVPGAYRILANLLSLGSSD